MSSESWIYVVYDSWTSKNAYFSSRDFADDFVEQEYLKEVALVNILAWKARDRYYVYNHRMDSGQWD